MNPSQRFARAACPVGFPDPNVECYVLDEALRAVPPGTTGELYVAGSGLGPRSCYLNKEALTLERYPPHPFQEGANHWWEN
eukprot:8200980-Pyramimonas_sp.AAC.1